MTPADVQVTFCATLVDQWVGMGMRHAVVAPGSRSTPMALALAARDDLRVHVAHDERTAAFMALGIGLSTGVPAALLCTSGTAAAHFHAAVVEADLSGVPMIVMTADRPPELQGVGAPQTIDQIEMYGDVVRMFVAAGVPDATEQGGWRGMALDAWLAACGVDPGPVHLNLPFREPLVGAVGDLPPTDDDIEGADDDVWFMTRLSMDELAAMLAHPRGVVVAGRGVDDAAAVGELAAVLGWPVLADPRSGCRHLPQAVCAFDPLLRDAGFAAAHRPDVVLHLGEPPASKVLGQWLQGTGAVHVQVHAQGRTIDPLGIIAERVYGQVGTVCEAVHPLLGDVSEPGWLASWSAAEAAAQQALTAHAERRFDEPAVARALSDLPVQLVLSSSMPVRDVEWFGAPGRTTVHSNRGANGIDGVIATAIGTAIGTDEPTVLLIGDVAFCHDQSSLTALAVRQLPLTIGTAPIWWRWPVPTGWARARCIRWTNYWQPWPTRCAPSHAWCRPGTTTCVTTSSGTQRSPRRCAATTDRSTAAVPSSGGQGEPLEHQPGEALSPPRQPAGCLTGERLHHHRQQVGGPDAQRLLVGGLQGCAHVGQVVGSGECQVVGQVVLVHPGLRPHQGRHCGQQRHGAQRSAEHAEFTHRRHHRAGVTAAGHPRPRGTRPRHRGGGVVVPGSARRGVGHHPPHLVRAPSGRHDALELHECRVGRQVR